MAGFRIKEVYAIVSFADDGDEGVVGYISPNLGLAMPLVAVDPARFKEMVELGQRCADNMRQNFKIIKLTVREEIGEIKATTTS